MAAAAMALLCTRFDSSYATSLSDTPLGWPMSFLAGGSALFGIGYNPASAAPTGLDAWSPESHYREKVFW